jgi:outer membrane lipoprotein SlyB
VLSLALIAPLLVAACQTDREAQRPPEQSQAQRDLRDNTEALGEPLDTVTEGTLLGGLLGGLSFGVGSGNNQQSVNFGVVSGALAGGLAGKYVAAKQEKYSEEVEVIEAITEDIRGKNRAAVRTVEAMELVVAEDRARLAEIRQAVSEGTVDEDVLEREVAIAEGDLKTMKKAATKAEEHADTFGKARSIVLAKSEDEGLEAAPEVVAMDGEIESLRARIRAMHDLIDELSSVS